MSEKIVYIINADCTDVTADTTEVAVMWCEELPTGELNALAFVDGPATVTLDDAKAIGESMLLDGAVDRAVVGVFLDDASIVRLAECDLDTLRYAVESGEVPDPRDS